ncbi:MAG: 3-hydroxyacyl-ACP dehydratase [Bacteroidetes bacterium]|nr:MAG: 3-hydroxyacyl-ACP dehydratase [Bacteroidota bacterium]
MLRNKFYRTLSTDKQTINEIESQVLINIDDPIFKGHFPEVPVVPGVCMLQMIKEQLEDRLGSPLQLVKAGNLKFLSVINPLENPELSISISYRKSDDGFINADASITYSDKVFFKLAKAIYR